MPIEIQCPTCGKAWAIADELAGRPVLCPACGATMGAGPAAAAPAAPAVGAAQAPEVLLTLAQAGTLMQIKMAAVFNIVVGILNVLTAGLMVFYAVMFMVGMPREMPHDSAGALKVMGILSGVAAFLSVVLAVLQIFAGAYLVMRKPAARTLGLVAGFASCVSLWGLCVWPLSLATGVYTLIVLFRGSTKQALQGPPEA